MKLLYVFGLFSLVFGTIGTNGLANQSKDFTTNYFKAGINSNYKSTNGAVEIIDEIIKVLGLKTNFEVKAANVPNAAAITYQGKRYILYNPQFIDALNKSTGNIWAAVSVLAHEIGHHLNGHTIDNAGSQPEQELEADEFSGFVLRRMGASLEQAQVAMKLAAGYKPSLTHPGKEDRLIAIAEGWQNADNQIKARTDIASMRKMNSSPSAGISSRPQPVLSDQNIIGDVSFRSDEGVQYFVTTKFNLVKFYNNQLYMVGKISELDYPGFSYMIYDENKNVLLVDTKGNILTKNGTPVGYMKARRI